MKTLNEYIKQNNVKPVASLGDGIYSGTMGGYIFKHKGKDYECSFGLRGMNCKVTIEIKNGKDKWIA